MIGGIMSTLCSSFESALSHYVTNINEQTKAQEQPKGLLVYSNAQWIVIPNNPKKILDKIFLDTTAKIVSEDLSIVQKGHLEKFLNFFNSSWTCAELAKKKIKGISKKTKGEIGFNSYGQYAWLSNFFHTLIYDSEHKKIYPSVESGYVAFKARIANDSEAEAKYAAELDPKKAKREGASLWIRQNEKDEEFAIVEMRRLVTLKFTQNSKLTELLCTSGNKSLVEHTSDPFWGDAYGSIDTETGNQLGKIISEIRENLRDID